MCVDGTIEFAPSLAGQTITNLSALSIGKNVTIDGAGALGLTISGSGSVRVLKISATITATVRNLTLADGYGWQLAGGVLNNGSPDARPRHRDREHHGDQCRRLLAGRRRHLQR